MDAILAAAADNDGSARLRLDAATAERWTPVIVTLILDMRLILQGERGGDRRLIVKRGGA